MTEDQRRNDVKILVKLGKIEQKIEDCIVPGIEQVWKNKTDINTLKTKQKLTQFIGAGVFTSVLLWFTKGHWMKH